MNRLAPILLFLTACSTPELATFDIHSTPPMAIVHVDGLYVGVTPCQFQIANPPVRHLGRVHLNHVGPDRTREMTFRLPRKIVQRTNAVPIVFAYTNTGVEWDGQRIHVDLVRRQIR